MNVRFARGAREFHAPQRTILWETLYEVRPRKDYRGVDLISDVLPFGALWYGEPGALANAIGYAKFYSRSHDAVIRVCDEAANNSTGAIEPGIDVHQDFYVVVVQEGGAVQHPSIPASGGNYRLANSYRN